MIKLNCITLYFVNIDIFNMECISVWYFYYRKQQPLNGEENIVLFNLFYIKKFTKSGQAL